MSGRPEYLVIRLAAAGDVLLTTALTRALRQAQPEAHIAWLTSAYAAPVLEGNSDLDEILVAPNPKPRRHLRAVSGMWSRLRRWGHVHPHATVLLAHRSTRLRLLLRASGFRRIAGWGREAMFEPSQHRLRQLGALLRAAGLEFAAGTLSPRLFLSAAERAAGADAWPSGAAVRWVIAPGGGDNPWARMPNRRWAPERFGALARQARAGGIAVRWAGGLEDGDLIQRCAPDLSLAALAAATASPLRHTAALIAAADLVIGNDSLPLVLAQALGRPALGLYGPTAGALIHAPGQPYLQGAAGCGPCYDPRAGASGRAYRCTRARCMEAISAASVWNLAQESPHV